MQTQQIASEFLLSQHINVKKLNFRLLFNWSNKVLLLLEASVYGVLSISQSNQAKKRKGFSLMQLGDTTMLKSIFLNNILNYFFNELIRTTFIYIMNIKFKENNFNYINKKEFSMHNVIP